MNKKTIIIALFAVATTTFAKDNFKLTGSLLETIF